MSSPAGRSQLAPLLRRLVSCLVGGVALAIMWGPQEGVQDDYGFALRAALFHPRIAVFLGAGVVAFFLITFWPTVRPFLSRPGVRPALAGVLTVVAAQTVLHWFDPLNFAKFGALGKQVTATQGISPVASAFFGWLAWVQLLVVVAVGAAAVVSGIRRLAWACVVLSVAAAVLTYTSQHAVVSFTGKTDHSYGALIDAFGYLVIAVSLATVAISAEEVANTRAFVNRVLGWRPGLPLAVLGLALGVYSLTAATWFSPLNLDDTFAGTRATFRGVGLAPLAVQYLAWLGWLLLGAGVVLSAAACWRRSRPLGWLGAAFGAAAVIVTLVVIHELSGLAAEMHFDGASGPWQNMGNGAWWGCAAFFVLGAAGLVAATARGGRRARAEVGKLETRPGAPGSAVPSPAAGRGRFLFAPGANSTALLFVIAFALFYPPTATRAWQTVLVTEIGIYVLLAVGLNVVVGWAGLLDLGFIAFYAIGSYVTAYFVGSLPIKPPSWLTLSPLVAIPFAVGICLLAGLALGSPTLRLRGDYLAIVTLGFGEIIRITAVNADEITNSTRGPSPQVPHPVIHIWKLHITWGLDQLQYWYLLLVIVVLVVLAFRRLENSRLGRAWAAVREDEVAAQATGINTYRVKLLAFAIGASTSGLAGVFFASNVGFFTPDNFILNNSILVLAYVVFGGMGSLPGAMAGAAVLWWIQEFLKDQVPPPDRQMWIGAVILLMMIFRPAGLIPAKRRQAELQGLTTADSAEPVAVPASGGVGVPV